MLLIFAILVRNLFYESSASQQLENPFPKILVWTTVFDRPPNFNEPCSNLPCLYTSDRSELNSADAVVFHAHDIRQNDLPIRKSKNPHQKYVLYSQEAPPSLSGISDGRFWKDSEFN